MVHYLGDVNHLNFVVDNTVPGSRLHVNQYVQKIQWPDDLNVSVHDPAVQLGGRVEFVLSDFGQISMDVPDASVTPRFHLSSDSGPSLGVRSRRVYLKGVTNLRDVGGYRTAAGVSSWDQTFRSDNLSSLTAEDWVHLRQLGVRRIIDLRNDDEVAALPTKLPEHDAEFEIIRIPMKGEILGTTDALDLIFKGAIDSITTADMCSMYVELLESHEADIMDALELLEADGRPPTLVHCTAGKDRTGLVMAFYLLRMGVTLEDALYDYNRSNLLRTPARITALKPRFEEAGIDLAQILPFLSAPPAAFFAAVDWVRLNRPELVGRMFSSQ